MPRSELHASGTAASIAQAEPAEAFGLSISPSLKAAGREALREALYRTNEFAVCFRPASPVRKQNRGHFRVVWPEFTAFLEPAPESILSLEVFVSRRHHSRRRLQSDPLPFEASLDRPGEDAVAFGQKPVRQVLVALGGRNGDRERHHVQSPSHGFVDSSDGGLVVAGNDELELRHELEEVLAHEAGGDLVPAGQCLELAFGPTPPLLGLDGGDETRPAESR